MPDTIATATAPHRPHLTFPLVVAELVRARYQAAAVVLEYGSGGSTVMAAEMPGKRVFTVEGDPAWAAGVQGYLDHAGLAAAVSLHLVDIGPTGEWGAPVNDEGWRRYHHYPLSVWDRADFQHPDVVLIDGRFRAACLLTTLLRIERPVTVLFDDYKDRKFYHRVEAFAEPVAFIGRMARFELEPRAFPKRDMTRIFDFFTRPH